MSLTVTGIITGTGSSEAEIEAAALKKLSLKKENVRLCGVYKTSLDARRQNDIKLVSSVRIELDDAEREKALAGRFSFCSYNEPQKSPLPEKTGSEKPDGRVIIAGFGPAGMFAALTLAEYGFRPLVIERGAEADERVAAAESFWLGGELCRDTNVQFGEGGAGTFSDGKLTTRINDPLCGKILDTFVQLGAPKEILTRAKPHVGTDNLRRIVKAMRHKIISLGGEIRFKTKLTGINASNGRVRSVTVNGSEEIPCGALVLAIGHSARDTFEMLLSKGVFMEPKPFSVGARIEHKQSETDESLYGIRAGDPSLPKGEYQLSLRKGGRGVYTFCMCPGGVVVPSQSEEDSVVTNGMSEYARNGENANSALVVSVSPDDFGKQPLDGVYFARSIEKKAFELAGKNYKAPASTVRSFLEGKGSLDGASVTPTYARGTAECGLNKLFPPFVYEMMKEGLADFSRKMKCFKNGGAVLTAPETRTSSPVRITRGEDMQSLTFKGLYPCGEGAGYAGGIMSAAADGMRAAAKIAEVYSSEE